MAACGVLEYGKLDVALRCQRPRPVQAIPLDLFGADSTDAGTIRFASLSEMAWLRLICDSGAPNFPTLSGLRLTSLRGASRIEEEKRIIMSSLLARLWSNDDGQDIAEYAVMLAVILVIVVGTIRLIGSNANTVFSQAASSIQ
jgi:Flp pilus assembly pilin Flp